MVSPLFRLWYLAVAISCFVTSCQGATIWNTLYSYADGKVYMHMKEGSLIALNFTVTGSDLPSYNLKNDQEVVPLPLPPSNASLFLVGTSLYGIAPDSSSNKMCADGLMSLYKYNSVALVWTQQSLITDMVSNPCFYLYLSIMASPTDNNTVYIFGGKSLLQGIITDRLLSLNVDSLTLADITTTTTPRPFYGAANVLAPTINTQLLIGGESLHGWLNMYQLASWSFISGWSSQSVSPAINSSSAVESRLFSLALPIFSPIESTALDFIAVNLTIGQVIVMGGVAADGSNVDPAISKLDLRSNVWSWQPAASTGLVLDDIIGAATILNTLVLINGLSQVLNKRSESLFKLSLFDVSTLEPVTTLLDNWRQYKASIASTSAGSNSVTIKAVVGTLVPVFVISITIFVVYLVFQYRRKQAEPIADDFSALNYDFGNFSSQDLPHPDTIHSSPFAGHDHTFEKMYKAEPHNESASTLGDDSINSWIMKKKLYDYNRIQSYDGSADNNSCETISVDNGLHGFSPINSPALPAIIALALEPKGNALPATNPMTPPRPSRAGERYSPQKTGKKSFSGLILLLDEVRDVQVLVSSKRRLVLRIANPDTSIDEASSLLDDTARKVSGSEACSSNESNFRKR